MAKSSRKHVTGNAITTKSWFGSHSEMIVENLENGMVVCEDDNGKYITFADRIDSGLADPRRTSSDRMMDKKDS